MKAAKKALFAPAKLRPVENRTEMGGLEEGRRNLTRVDEKKQWERRRRRRDEREGLR